MAWNGPKWLVSRYNFAPEVMSNTSFSHRMEIYDWTLQGDGEEMPGTVFTREEKLEIAKTLDEVHVHRINAGTITPSLPDDLHAVKTIAHLGLNAEVEAFIGVSCASIDLALKADVSGIVMELPSSDSWIQVSKLTRTGLVDQALETAAYAKRHGLKVTFGLQDATRADSDFLINFVASLEQTKVDAICIADSSGVASPDGFRHLIRTVSHHTKLPIAIHCHNDFGLATANALVGLSSGAAIATTTVNGIGERCGLTSLEELVMALRLLYNVDLGIKLEKLKPLSQIVERATAPTISKLKPIVGERAFAWETDDFVERTRNLMAIDRLKEALPYEPDLVGNDFTFYPGKKTGVQGVKSEAERLGFTLTDQQADQLVNKIRELSMQKKQPSKEDLRNMLRRT